MLVLFGNNKTLQKLRREQSRAFLLDKLQREKGEKLRNLFNNFSKPVPKDKEARTP